MHRQPPDYRILSRIPRFACAVLFAAVALIGAWSPAHAQTPAATITPTATPTPTVKLTVTPQTLHFSFQIVLPPDGVPSKPKNVTLSLSNKQPAAVQIQSIVVSPPGEFSVGQNPCTTIAPGRKCEVPIVFTPSGVHGRRAVLIITSSATSSPQSIQLIGHGKQGAVSINPRSLDFGTVKVGEHSPPRTVTVRNKNAAPMSLSGISSSNPEVFAEFPVENSCAGTLGPGQSCVIQIQFQPIQAGPISGSFFVSDNAVKSPQAIHVSGNGSGPRPTRTPTPTATPSPSPTPAPGGPQLPMRALPVIR